MKARIEPRINLDNRTKLEEVIPLSVPFVLFVDPSSICNLKCRFCSNTRIKNKNIMNFDLFKKIIDDLKEFDKPLKVLRLYKEGEPLLNKKFPDMVRYAKSSQLIQNIDTTTNGTLLNPKLSKEILDAGLSRINISVNGMSDKQYLEFTGTKIDLEKYINNIRNFYDIREENGYKCDICIKTTGDFLKEEEKIRFYDTFGDYADILNIENYMDCWPLFNVEDHLKDIDKDFKINQNRGIYNQLIDGDGVAICPYIYYSITINSDGSISLCFLDWDHKSLIGDIKKQGLKEIWNGNLLHNYQIQNISGNRKENIICRDCRQLIYGMPDNIDKFADVLKERLLASR
jgi:radical SAM protein with 4Fe4S-binding SPASM domain